MSQRNTRSSTRNTSRRNPTHNNPIPEHLLEPPFDRTRFVGHKAQQFFNQYGHRNCTVEKEFQYSDMDLDEVFDYYGWKRLASRPSYNGVSTLVKEFYANAAENGTESPYSMVRGVQVDYSARAINEAYGLATPAHCEYEDLMDSILTRRRFERKKYELVSPTFPDFDPNHVTKGVVALTKFVELRIRALHRFICESIMPSTHSHEIHYTRAALIQVALNLGHINTGAIIRKGIQEAFKGMGTSNYNHSLLITRLIVRAGVNLAGMHRDLVPGTPITRQSLVNQAHFKAHNVASTSGAQPMEQEEEGFVPNDFEEEEEEEDQNQEANQPDWELHPDEATFYVGGMVEGLVEDFGRFQVRVDRQFEVHDQWRGGVDTSLQALQQRQQQFEQRQLGMEQRQIEMQQQQMTEYEAARAWREQQSRQSTEQQRMLEMMWARLAPPPQLPPYNPGGWDHHYRPPPQ